MATELEVDPDRLWLNPRTKFSVVGSPIQHYNRRLHGWFLSRILPDGRYEIATDGKGGNDSLGAIATPSVLTRIDPVTLGERTHEGQLVSAVRTTWAEIVKHVQRDRSFLYEFRDASRVFEMFVAATYRMDGFSDVILTPRSGDHGRDVIASKPGVRILDQAKAYGPRLRVTHEDVRAILGVVWCDRLSRERAANPQPAPPSLGAITTTSDFAPSIFSDFRNVIPDIVDLWNGTRLRDRLLSIVSRRKTSKRREAR